MKTGQNSQCSKASNTVLVTCSHAVRGVKSLCGLQACNLVMVTMIQITLAFCELFLGH